MTSLCSNLGWSATIVNDVENMFQKLKSSQKIQENKFDTLFSVIFLRSYFDYLHKIPAFDKVSCVSYMSFNFENITFVQIPHFTMVNSMFFVSVGN